MSKPIAIIFNMPKNNGKDYVCEILSKEFGWGIVSFKQELVSITCDFFGIKKETWEETYNKINLDGSREKDTKMKSLFYDGKELSQREALILVSETIIKPKFGKNYFGKCLAKKLKENQIYLIPDGGFNEEADEINKVSNLLILQRDRFNVGWESDSRNWIYGDYKTIKIDVPNEETPDRFLKECKNVILNFTS